MIEKHEYSVEVPLDGPEGRWYEIARCEDEHACAALMSVLLANIGKTYTQVRIIKLTRLVTPPA